MIGSSDLSSSPGCESGRQSSVKTDPTRTMVALCVVTLMKASSCNYCRPTRAAPRETLESDFSDRTMTAPRCCFSLGSIVLWSKAGRERQEVERLCLARSFGGDVKSACPTGATLCHACLAGATHDGSSRVFSSRWMSVGRGCRWAPWWRRRMAGLAMMMRISLLKMSQWFDDDREAFKTYACGVRFRSAAPAVSSDTLCGWIDDDI